MSKLNQKNDINLILGQLRTSIRETIMVIQERTPNNQKTLAQYGWYLCGLSSGFDSLWLGDFAKENHGQIDAYMTNFYQKNLKKLVMILSELHPERAGIIKEAARAHRLKMYYSSTLLFLSQADGIYNGALYKAKNSKGHLKKVLAKNNKLNDFAAAITSISAIDAPFSERHLYPSQLNRHNVMHGLDNEFGTKTNSLKGLSLLAFVGEFLKF